MIVATTLTVNALATDSPLLPRLDKLFRDFTGPDTPGASVMVIQAGKMTFAKGYGLANVEDHIPCSTNTNFRLASVTKQFTAMAIMILAERKKLAFDEPLSNFFPEFPDYGRQITVRHLLTHTSGLADYEDVVPPGTAIPVLDRDVLRLLMQQPKTDFAPGSKFRYSNSAYALLALIVEVRSGETFAHFLKQNVFQPLNMSNTLAYESGSSLVPHRAFGYTAGSGRFERTDQSVTSSVLGDGGIYSSIADLYQWDQAWSTGKLIGQDLATLAVTPGPATDHPETGYGFGWYIGRYRGLKEIWHSGNTRGFTTRIARFPEKQFSVVVLCNRSDAPLAEIPHRIVDLVLFE